MSDAISVTHDYLLQHRPLLTLNDLAEMMHSTLSGLCMAMSRKKEPFTNALAQARRRVGRRFFLKASPVAELIDQKQPLTDSADQP